MKFLPAFGGLQFVMIFTIPTQAPVNPYLAFGALVTAPVIEEIVRAVVPWLFPVRRVVRG